MKKKIRLTTFAMLIFAAPFIVFSQSNPPPPPNNGSGPGVDNTPVGGNAPIDGGLTIMLFLGAAYGSKKLLRKRIDK